MRNKLILLFAIVLTTTIVPMQALFGQDGLDDTDQYAQYQESIQQKSTDDNALDDDNVIVDNTLFVPESWDTNLDELMNSWYVKNHTKKRQSSVYQESFANSDSIYVDRLSRLHNIMELPYNEIIRNCIDLYVDRRRSSVEYMLGLENFYFPMIEQVLDEHQLPIELKYLAVIESALNPVALSRAGASGLWQFMLPTGKQYDLEINSLIDERRDPLKSTYAACRFLSDLYAIYGDWNLVIAAYNCGPGNVNKAIRRANGSTDYWKIYPYLPKETRSYVPLFIAANYVMNYHAEHQLYPVETSLPAATDTIMVEQQVHFDQISSVLGIEKEQLRALNPQYKKDVIPGNSTKPRTLRLPSLQVYAFIEKQDEIVKYKADELFSNRTYVGNYNSNNRNEKITHKVKSGENLTSIANKYGVTTSNIRKWNGLKTNKVNTGRQLTLYVDNGGYASRASTTKTNTTTASTKKATSSTKATTTKPASTNTKTSNDNQAQSLGKYRVREGDSFYSIAKKYPGYSHTDLMKMNNMRSSSLKVGQYIKVPKN